MMARYLGIWALATLVLSVVLFVLCNLAGSQLPRPDAASARWVQRAWSAALSGEPPPAAPASARDYRGAGPTFVSLYTGGSLRARHVGDARLVESVLTGIARLSKDPAATRDRAELRVVVTTASAPVIELLPWLSTFAIVPLREGASATLGSRTEYVLPDDLLERQLIDHAVAAPVPDLSFGTSLQAVRGLLGIALGSQDRSLHLSRVRVEPVVEPQPATDLQRLDLEHAARQGLAFILRHQHRSGRFTYVYDAHRDAEIEGSAYSFARHAGSMFFLARAAVQLGSKEARSGALRALGYIEKDALSSCGSEDHLCVEQRGRVEFGASALTALACAELLRSGDDADVRKVLTGLLAFLRAQQRPDGEMMHEYSREREEPIDVQHMYYSGEAALALLTAYEQLHDPRDLEASSRLMTHLTGAGWGFFGARYYYGEEHWTCQAVAKAAAHMPVGDALDFCVRWGRWQEKLQYQRGVTPWDVAGAFGAGPVLLPRVTTAASRVEALVPIYRVLATGTRGFRKADLHSTRGLIERSLGLLLRMRWAPGPTHLFARPPAALGGMPSTAAELRSRVDMVQHAGSAFLVWADALAHLD